MYLDSLDRKQCIDLYNPVFGTEFSKQNLKDYVKQYNTNRQTFRNIKKRGKK